jgi:hypothetical protein
MYSHKFTCLDASESKSIFYQTLQKVLVTDNVTNIDNLKISGKKMISLVELLEKSKIPLTKEYMIEQIWDVQYDPAFDNRLYKLIQKLKKKYNVKVLNFNNTYKLAS